VKDLNKIRRYSVQAGQHYLNGILHMYMRVIPCSFAGASHSSLTGGQAPETSSSAAESTWQGQVDIHVAQPASRSRFVEQLEQEPDLEASVASQQEAQAAAVALAEAARHADAHITETSV